MPPTAYALRDFYKTIGGRVVRRLIRDKITTIWPSVQGLRCMGAGYAAPYMQTLEGECERAMCVMFTGQGIHAWPSADKNAAVLCAETDLPFETNSVDRIVLIHSLEFTGFLIPALEEMYRVLKSSGRILIVVPNRMGLWARADWTPFGHGEPYSAKQVESFLAENLFVVEQTHRALFIPPFKSQALLRTALFWERIGEKICPAMGGVLLVEATKQIYAGRTKALSVKDRAAALALKGQGAGLSNLES